MTLQAIELIEIRLDGKKILFEPGAIFTVTEDQAWRILERAQGRVRLVTLPTDLPDKPILPGWLVAYRDAQGRLVGGGDDRDNGTVRDCHWNGTSWHVNLTNGDRFPLARVRSVGKTDKAGQIVSAWTVREHDYDREERS